MLTENAEKMLLSLHAQAAEGCLLGAAIWGDKEKNNIQTLFPKCVKELGFELPKVRPKFYLYDKIEDLASKTGWELILTWDQVCSFPFMDVDGIKKYGRTSVNSMSSLN